MDEKVKLKFTSKITTATTTTTAIPTDTATSVQCTLGIFISTNFACRMDSMAIAETSFPSVNATTTLSESIVTTDPTTEDYFMSFNTTNHTLRIKGYPALANFHGYYDKEYIARINSFWLEFSPPSPRAYYIMAVIYITISSIGCFGNALVIYMFIRCKSLRTHANTLVLNLAVSDFFMLAKCPIAIYNSIKLGPALGDIGCRLYGFIGGLTGTVSIITLTAIAVDRYNVVVHPLEPLRSARKLNCRLTLCFIWLYSFSFAVIPSLDIGLSVYVPEGFLTTCSFDYLSKSTPARIFMFVFFVGAWCIPFGIIFYCYFFILKVVSAAGSIQSNKDRSKTEVKLAAIVIGVIGLWFFAWTPYSVVALLGISGNEHMLTPLGSMIPAIFCKTSACIDPYIYAVIHPRFRMEFRRMFLWEDYIRRTSTYRSSFPTRYSSSRRHRVVRDAEVNKTNNSMGSLKKISGKFEEAVVMENCKIDLVAEVDQSKF